MKITMSISTELYDKLERDRGIVPRSTFIQELIRVYGMNVATDVATEKKETRHVTVHKEALGELTQASKVEKIKPTTFKSYFKNDNLNKGLK